MHLRPGARSRLGSLGQQRLQERWTACVTALQDVCYNTVNMDLAGPTVNVKSLFWMSMTNL